jgi:hypothetical protein
MAPPLFWLAELRPSVTSSPSSAFEAIGLQAIEDRRPLRSREEKPLKIGSRNSSLSRLARTAAIAAGALFAASASFAQVKPATPTPPTRARSGPAQQKQRALSPQQDVRKPSARQPGATRPPTVAPPSAKPAPRTPPPLVVDPLPPPQAPPPVDVSQPPPALPRAPREKMRACAEEWDRMKRESKEGLPMWRDFATKCLTR